MSYRLPLPCKYRRDPACGSRPDPRAEPENPSLVSIHPGFELLHPARTEPWGQTVTRLLTDDGLIVGISYAPLLHDGERA